MKATQKIEDVMKTVIPKIKQRRYSFLTIMLCLAATLSACSERQIFAYTGIGYILGYTFEDATREVDMLSSDNDIRTDISAVYFRDPVVDASHVNILVYNHVVTLTGTVPTTTSKERAEEIARKTKGVRAVHSQIEVAPLAH